LISAGKSKKLIEGAMAVPSGSATVSRRLVHLPFNPKTGSWVGSVQGRLANSSDPLIKMRLQKWGEHGLGELSLAVTTKLAMLPIVERRIDACLEWLIAELRSNDQVFQECAKDGAVFPLPHEHFLYELLVDLDCFFFESRSTYEILGKFVSRFVEHVLDRKTSELELVKALTERGLDIRWIRDLRESRKLFFHQNALWIAIDAQAVDLVLMKENVLEYDPETCLDLQVLREIHAGLRSALPAISEWLCERVAEIERRAES
jgi:hypothetical protein